MAVDSRAVPARGAARHHKLEDCDSLAKPIIDRIGARHASNGTTTSIIN
jgi:hypothetical protein